MADALKESAGEYANTAMKINRTLNRMDLLTDSKIGEIKGLMKDLAEQILKMNKRVTMAENDMLRKEYE